MKLLVSLVEQSSAQNVLSNSVRKYILTGFVISEIKLKIRYWSLILCQQLSFQWFICNTLKQDNNFII